jgi:hypothetical protein
MRRLEAIQVLEGCSFRALENCTHAQRRDRNYEIRFVQIFRGHVLTVPGRKSLAVPKTVPVRHTKIAKLVLSLDAPAVKGVRMLAWKPTFGGANSWRAEWRLTGTPVFRYPTQRIEIPASGHYFLQHRSDFSVDDDVRPAVHVGRLAVDNGERGAVRLCDHR